jgi:hypothetical protein
MIRTLIRRLRDEPILLMTAGIVGLTAFRDATVAGIGTEDALVYVAEALLGFIGRSLVWPSSKVSTDGVVTEDLPAPVLIGGDDPH